MSYTNRKVGNYAIEFEKNKENFFDKDLFFELLEYIDKLEDKEKIFKKEKYSKAISIENINKKENLFEIIFKNCKYNHSPKYMSSVDGKERVSDKKLIEGEKEITHLLAEIKENEFKIILEERRTGVSIIKIVEFLEYHMKKFLKENNKKKDFKIIKSIIPGEEFIKKLEKMQRITVAEINTYKGMLGSEELNKLQREDKEMREEIVVQFKAKKEKTLSKIGIRRIFYSLANEESNITRIRIVGKDNSKNEIRIDTDSMKKIEYLNDVELMENGTIKSSSIFSKMEKILGENS